ncbi:hypothetical protein Bca4012_100216 [Brassica carinata]
MQLTSPLRFGRIGGCDDVSDPINVQDERFPRTSSCSVHIETSQRKQVRQTKPCSKAPPTKKISLFDLKDNVFVILTGWWLGIDMRSTAKMDETGIKVSGWNYKSVGEVERKQGSINFTTNLSQLDLDLRLQLPKLPLPSINTYNSYSFFSYQGVEVRLSAVNTRMICCRRPGLLLATRKALDKLGFGCHQAVISCFDRFAVHNFVVPYFVVCEYQQYQGHEILLDSIKAVLSYTVGYDGMI